MQPLFWGYFSSGNHNGFWEDCSITVIGKTDEFDSARRQEYWKGILKTVTPYGLTTIDWLSCLGKPHCYIHTFDIFP